MAGIAQASPAVALLADPTRRRLVAAAAASLAVIAFWVLTRTIGLPGPNPWLPLDTAVGFTDVLWPPGCRPGLVPVHGANHGLDNPSQQPTPDQIAKMAIDFFADSLLRG